MGGERSGRCGSLGVCRGLGRSVYGAEPQVLAVVDRLVEELGDVVVVEGVHDAAAVPLPFDQAEVAQQAQLVRDRGLLHAGVRRQFADGGRATSELDSVEPPLGPPLAVKFTAAPDREPAIVLRTG